MHEKRREDCTPEPTKFQVLATEGVPTFLLLEDAAARNHQPVRPDAEGERLGMLAEEIEGRLPPPERRPWPGGVAVTLGELAVRDFFPRAAAPPNVVVPNRGLYRALADGRYVRAVNFHATPPRLAGRLEEQLTRLARSFVPVSHDDLVSLVTTGDWPHERPGVVLNFIDGFRDNFEVAAPILGRLSLVGWFFVVSDWVTTPPGEQRSFATHHLIDLPYNDGDLPADGRLALSPDEVVGALAERGHVVASHTRTHATASPELVPNPPPAALEQEVASQRDLERLVGLPVRALAWREGTPLEASIRADGALADTGYELLFANHAIQRVP